MAFKINGVIISETSKVNSATVWGTGNNMNGVQLNICYTYELTNNNAPPPPPPPPAPPPPPDPPINFTYTDCFGTSQNVNVDFGAPQNVCALVGTVSVPGGGSSSIGSRCTS
jgi:hypothetical protein